MAAAETAARSSGGGATADSYVGSLISLTSKSEIRYEGILYNINTEDSSIGLRNVRSFGTEGRKKDGPQVPPSDKVYEYILFRGSDIKDLQVKSPPSAQTMPPINSDPAIIQSHYSRPTTSLPANASGPLTEVGSQSAQLGYPGSNFRSGLALCQPGGNVGSWGPSPPSQNANSSGVAMPMYWQGFYGAPNGVPQMHQQSLLRPPSGLLMPPSMQQMQFSGYNPSLASGTSKFPEYSTLWAPSTTNSLNLTPTSLPASTLFTVPPIQTTLPSTVPPIQTTFPSTVPPVQPMSLPSETHPTVASDKAPVSGISSKALAAHLPSTSAVTTSGPDVNAVIPQVSGKPNAISVPSLSYQTASQTVTSVAGMFNPVLGEAPALSLVTPGQLLQSGAAASPAAVPSVQSLQTAQKDVKVVQVSPKQSLEAPAAVHPETQPPILPLPQSAHVQKPNGANFHTRQNFSGSGGRGAGMSRPVTSFTDEFDFMAMNEKFKKEEVWGSLGKGNKLKEEGYGSDEDNSHVEDGIEFPNDEIKSVYNKDAFFDNLSSNTVANNSTNGRMRFSEQLKLDTETFGDFPRYWGGPRGRSLGRGGRSRGSYYGRGNGCGYGYVGRDRGRGV